MLSNNSGMGHFAPDCLTQTSPYGKVFISLVAAMTAIERLLFIRCLSL